LFYTHFLLQILKILATVVIGFVFSLSSTLLGVTTVRSLQGRTPPKPTTGMIATRSRGSINKQNRGTSTVGTTSSSSPFSEAQWNFCWKVTIVSGILSMAATTAAADSALVSPLQMIFTLFFTVSSYIWGSRLPNAFVKLCHPLVTASVLLLGLIRGLAFVTGRDYLKVLASYKTGTLSPLRAGAGDYLLYLLGPGVVAFAVSVYGKRSLLFSNLPMVLTAMMVSSVGGLFATGAFVRLIQLGGPNGSLVRLSVLARNVTMALAMALTDMIGGDVAIIALVVCLTGIIGASYGIPLLDAMGVTDPICRGLGIGSSAQGLGVASIAGEPDAFAFASVAMVLTAVAGTTIVSFPAVRNALIQVTTGQKP
jgi:putative effector of murein hydrolase